MPRFAFVTVGVPSHVNQCSELARRLRARGHEVVFLSHDAAAGRTLAARGFSFVPLETPRQGPRRPVPPQRLRRVRAEVRRDAAAVLESREILDRLDELVPDVVLVDYELQDHVIRLLSSGRRLLLIEYHCSPRRTPRVPVLSSDLAPTGSAPDRWRFAASWWWTALTRRLGFALARICYGRHEFICTLRRLAARYEVDFARQTSRRDWHFLSFPTVPTLYLSWPEFDFPNDFPNRAYFVGPQIGSDRRDDLAGEDARRVRDWLAASSERPLIYCALGAILSKPAFYRQVLGAAARRPDWRVLLAVGREGDVDALGPVPENALIVCYAPQLEVLSVASAMLTHGGASSIAECVCHGVAMVVFSGGVMDENGNAARVAYHRLGNRGELDRAGADDIVRAVGSVLGDAGIAAAVADMQAVCRESLAADRAVGLLETAASRWDELPPWRIV